MIPHPFPQGQFMSTDAPRAILGALLARPLCCNAAGVLCSRRLRRPSSRFQFRPLHRRSAHPQPVTSACCLHALVVLERVPTLSQLAIRFLITYSTAATLLLSGISRIFPCRACFPLWPRDWHLLHRQTPSSHVTAQISI